MSPSALILVLISCVTHAGWNLLAKRSRTTTAFFWFAGAVVVVAATPAFVVLGGGLGAAPASLWLCLLATGLWQAAYYAFLASAYRHGDISVVYPLARTTPLFVVPLAGLIQGEWPSAPAAAGLALVVVGCFLLPRKSLWRGVEPISWRSYANPASLWALATALASSAYTVTDDLGMEAMGRVAPGFRGAFLYGYLEWVSTTLWLLAPVLIQNRPRELARVWRRERPQAVAVGLLTFFTYLLVLRAYALSEKVAYVAGFRQLSIVLAVFGGIYLLREPGGGARVAGSVVIAAGLVLIAFAR